MALWAQACPTLGARASGRQEVGSAHGADGPADEHCSHVSGYRARRGSFLVGHRLAAMGTVVVGPIEGSSARCAAADEDHPAVGAHLGPGEEFHAALRAGEGEFQTAVGAVCFVVYGAAAAGTEGLPARGAGGVAPIDAGAAAGARPVGWLPGPRFGLRWRLPSHLRGRCPGIEDEAAMWADAVLRVDRAIGMAPL